MDESGPPAVPAAPTAPAAPQAPAVPPPPSSTPRATWLRTAWFTALGGAVVAVVAGFLLAEVVAFIGYAGNTGTVVTVPTAAGAGGIIFYEFHHVAISLGIPGSALSRGSPIPVGNFEASLGLAAMGGTLLLVWVLARAGREAGVEAAGPVWNRALCGAKVALPYAALCFLISFAVHLRFPVQGSAITLRPSAMSAFFWPLGIGMVAGALGGARSADEAAWGEPWGRRLRGGLWGGLAMMGNALGLAFASMLGLAVVMPHATADYFRGAFSGGAISGIDTILANLLVVPNMAAWVLFPGMGACVGGSGSFAGTGVSYCVLSYTHFPSGASVSGAVATGGLPSLTFSHPPAVYYLFLLVPLLAVVGGGWWSARLGRAESTADAAVIGAMAGVVFGLVALGVAELAVITGSVTGSIGPLSGSGGVSLGPNVTQSFLAALAWGVVGGALGGLIASRSIGSRAPAGAAVPGPSGDTMWGVSSSASFPPPAPEPPPGAPAPPTT